MFLFILSLVSLVPFTASLRCYEGSKGVVNGVESSNFVERTCDEEMIHCFESYSDDWTEVTASCQTPNTDEKLLDVCKSGCVNHNDINITVCCCDSDLCNLPSRKDLTSTLPPKEDIKEGDKEGNQKEEKRRR